MECILYSIRTIFYILDLPYNILVLNSCYEINMYLTHFKRNVVDSEIMDVIIYISFFDIMMYFYVLIRNMEKLSS